jgi:hypothetical protein
MRYAGIVLSIAALCVAGAWITGSDLGPTPLGFFITWAIGGLMSLLVALGWRVHANARSVKTTPPAAKPQYVVRPPRPAPWLAAFLTIELVGFGLMFAAAHLPPGFSWAVAVLVGAVQALLLWLAILRVLPQSWDLIAWALSWASGVAIACANGWFVYQLVHG